jgi:hypothetical protein
MPTVFCTWPQHGTLQRSHNLSALPQGHLAKTYPLKPEVEATHTTALLLHGNPEDLQLPVHRPEMILCHLHGHPIIQRELRELSKAYIIDATHLDKHLASVRGDINRALKWSVPFDLSHLKGSKYLLRFSVDASTHVISSSAQSYLDYEGYLYHQWTPTIGSMVATHPFKLWLDIVGVPPQLWELTSPAELKKFRRCSSFDCAVRSFINGSDLTVINSLMHQNSCLDFPTAVVIFLSWFDFPAEMFTRKFSTENTNPQLWSTDELVKGVPTILDHAPLHNVSSFEQFHVLVAAPHLNISKSITFLLGGSKLHVRQMSWVGYRRKLSSTYHWTQRQNCLRHTTGHNAR